MEPGLLQDQPIIRLGQELPFRLGAILELLRVGIHASRRAGISPIASGISVLVAGAVGLLYAAIDK